MKVPGYEPLWDIPYTDQDAVENWMKPHPEGYRIRVMIPLGSQFKIDPSTFDIYQTLDRRGNVIREVKCGNTL